MAIVFDLADFRVRFPEFANIVDYPDATLQTFFGVATCYVTNADNPCLSEACLTEALYLMTAHLLAVNKLATEGKTPSFVTSSTVGSVSVSRQPPPQSDQWIWWLNLTPYGMQVATLLSAAGVSGFYVGGAPERSAFRRVGGVFG